MPIFDGRRESCCSKTNSSVWLDLLGKLAVTAVWLTKAGLMLGHRLRRWPSIKSALARDKHH